MKYMRWGWVDYQSAPAALVAHIRRLMIEETERNRKSRK